MHIEVHLAPHPAVGAGGADFLNFPGTAGKAGLAEGNCAHGANVGALAAEVAFRVDIVLVEGRSHLGVGAAHGEIENFVHLDFVAGPHAPSAEDAFVEVPRNHRVCIFVGMPRRLNAEAGLFDFQPVDQVLQFAGAVLLAGQAVVVSRRPEQFDDQTLCVANRLCIRADFHARADRHAAGGDQGSCTFHLHDANPAGADAGRFRVMAKGGNVDSVRAGDLQDGLPGIGLQFTAVHRH